MAFLTYSLLQQLSSRYPVVQILISKSNNDKDHLRYQCTPNLIIFQKKSFSLFQIDLIAIFQIFQKIDSKQSY